MFQTLKNAWKIQDLRKKLLFTLLIIALYQLGANIPVPYVSPDALGIFNTAASGSILQYMSILSGDSFGKATLFALSVTPYITASIVMELLCVAIPPLERISKEEDGRKKITSWTRWVTMLLAVITAVGYFRLLDNYGMLSTSAYDGKNLSVFAGFVVVICYCAGASLIMWLAEKINQFGIGNGISIILFANIIARCPEIVKEIFGLRNLTSGGKTLPLYATIPLMIFIVVAVVAAVIFMIWFTESERRIPVQYAKRVVGRKMYGGQSSNLPLKMNMAGVMPIIFASSIVSIPATIVSIFMNGSSNGFAWFITNHFNYNSWLYVILDAVLIILFSYFYIMISFNPVEVANNIKNNGGAVLGIRPGKPTSDYISRILKRVTTIGGVFLILICCLPMIASIILGYFTEGGGNVAMAFSGSSLLIVVGVALETFREIESQMAMRNYKGFLD